MVNKAFVVFESPSSIRYKIGILERNTNGFTFSYIPMTLDIAMKNGFGLLKPFPNTNKTYRSDVLFPIFSSRLPNSNCPDLSKILETYGLDAYDEFDLLIKSGAKLPIDSLSFEEYKR